MIDKLLKLLKLFRRRKWVKDFPCDNWDGTYRRHCGHCVDRGDDWQNWAYKEERP